MLYSDAFMSLFPALGGPIIIKRSIWSLTTTLRVKQKKNDDIDTHVNELTDELQDCCDKNTEEPYAEQDGDYRKDFNTWLSK